VFNETGHKLPTGYPEGRRMWIYLKAINETGDIVFESGKYDSTTQDLLMDPYIKIYETKQGISPSLATELGVSEGESFNFVLNNTIIKDNRIPPRGVTQLEYNQPGLQSIGLEYQDYQYWDTTTYPIPSDAISITVMLLYQVASKDYIDFLGDNGGYDGYILNLISQTNPSTPNLIAIKFEPGYDIILPLVYR
jgi:hypothetical protein